jgi:hypothetical protein
VNDPRYPIGPFAYPGTATAAERRSRIDEIAAAPAALRSAVRGLGDAQLDTPYRDGGWTVRQVVHHVPDSHVNAYVRMKLALTEDRPVIKPYEEKRWAELPDGRAGAVEPSLSLLDHLHERWVRLLRALDANDFTRTLHHPEAGTLDLDYLVAMYAWHGRHHVAHITTLRERIGW